MTAQTTDQLASPPIKRQHRSRFRWLTPVLRNRWSTTGLIILLIFVALAVLTPILVPGNPNAFVADPNLTPSAAHWLGTTGQGQDVLHQLLWGARVSLTVSAVVGVLTTLIAATVAMAAAYFGGVVDEILSLITNVFLVMPGLPLMIILAVFLPAGGATIVLVLTVTGWAWGARYLRSQALSVRQRDFVWAEIVTGERAWRVMFVEILPNVTSILVAYFINQVVYAIGAEAALEFLGLGAPNQVTWGTMLYWSANNSSLLQGAWWTFVAPGIAIALVAASLTMLNYAMDETANPRLRAVRELRRFLKQLPRGTYRPGRATAVVRDAS